MEQIAAIILEELARFEGEETTANALRCAAWFALDEAPDCTPALFGDAAASVGVHRGSAMNRFREAMKNLEAA